MSDRTVRVAPERLAGWVERFGDRHGETSVSVLPDECLLRAADGATARIALGWGGLPPAAPRTLDAAIAHVCADLRVGVLLARRAAHAVGVFDGRRLVASKVDTRYVQSRTKAGGWSQQRYARRRANQADDAARSAAADLDRVVGQRRDEWDWFVTGGDAAAVRAVLALTPTLAALAPAAVLATPEPRLTVLQAFPASYLAVPITLNDLA